MGLFGGLISGVVNTVTLPIATVKVVVDVVQEDEPTTTAGQIGSAFDDVVEGVEDFCDKGEIKKLKKNN